MRSRGLSFAVTVGTLAVIIGAGAPPQPAAAGSDDDIRNKLILDSEGQPDEGTAPLKVKFKTSADEPVQKPEYTWDFDDGTADSREASPTHVFKKPGLYKVRVKLRDAATGKRGSDEIIVDVEEPEPAPGGGDKKAKEPPKDKEK